MIRLYPEKGKQRITVVHRKEQFAMKKYLSLVLATLLIMSVAGCVGQTNTSKQSVVSDTNTSASTPKSEDIPDDSFSKEDYEKLLVLQFDDYQHMTVSEFQDKVWEMTDTPEYMELLGRFSKSEALYQMKDSDETAGFLFYILEPLTAENWKTRSYSGAAVSDLPAPAENAKMEYTYTLTILAPDSVMVKDYNDMRLGVKDALDDILRNRTKEELQNETFMLTELKTYVDEILADLQTPEVSIAIEYAYFPLPAENDNHTNAYQADNAEQRRYPNGTEEDYQSLLTLRTPNYQNMSIVAFNSSLLEWANEDTERSERIDEDTKLNDFPVSLTAEDISFIKWTVYLSGMENGKTIQSIYTGTEPNRPYYGEYLSEKTVTGCSDVARCSLYYQFSYSISDVETVTVGERDRQIEGMINAVQTFWSDTDVESVLKMSEKDILAELEKDAATYSTEHVAITIDKECIHFECMDERQYMMN